MSFAGELSGDDDGVLVELVEFLGVTLGRGTRVGLPLISGHLVSEGGNVLIDLSGHGVFTGSLGKRNSCAVLGEMGRLARGTLQATAGDHDRNGTFLDEVVRGRAEKDAGRIGEGEIKE